MFKCTECERLYDIKPDYCDDCGNDVFEEIVEKIENTEETEKVIAKEPEVAPKTETISELKIEKIENEKIKTDNVKIKRDIDYLSWGFLGICILISLYIIFFAWNPKELDETQQKPTETNKVNPNIPTSVNGFWNNEPPKVEVKPQITQPQVTQSQVQPQEPQEAKPVASQTQKEQPKIVSKTPEIKKPAAVSKVQPQQVQKPTQKQTQQKPTQIQTQQKTTQQNTQQKAQTVAKPAQTTKPQTTTKPNTTTPKTTTQKPTTTNTTPVWQSIQQTTPAQTTTKPTTTQTTQSQQTVNTTALKKELDNYKIALRNTIGRKIDFANVIGDGSCTVAFKIADSGKLTNRSFSQQSSNTTLNDAVYAAVMSTPSYNPPPSGYKGETLHLKITFYNGNFQISLN